MSHWHQLPGGEPQGTWILLEGDCVKLSTTGSKSGVLTQMKQVGILIEVTDKNEADDEPYHVVGMANVGDGWVLLTTWWYGRDDLAPADVSCAKRKTACAEGALPRNSKRTSDVMAAVAKGPYCDSFGYVSEVLTPDQEIVMAAVSNNGLALQYATPILRDNFRIVLVAVNQNGLALFFAGQNMRSNRQVVLAAVKQNGDALEDACELLQSDRELVLAAVAQSGDALGAATKLHSDREVVLTAVAQSGLALQHASENLMSDREVVISAVVQDGLALQYAARELTDDNEIVMHAVAENGLALHFAGATMQSNRQVVLTAVAQDSDALEFASDCLRSDRTVVLAALAQDGLSLQYASAALQADHQVVLAAVTQNSDVLQTTSRYMRNLIPRLQTFRPFQRLLIAAIGYRGVDCHTAEPLVRLHLHLSADIVRVVLGHLELSTIVPSGPVELAWHPMAANNDNEQAVAANAIMTQNFPDELSVMTFVHQQLPNAGHQAISAYDIESYAQRYRGSEEERADLISFYTSHYGNISRLLACIPLARQSDYSRFLNLYEEEIRADRLPEYDLFYLSRERIDPTSWVEGWEGRNEDEDETSDATSIDSDDVESELDSTTISTVATRRIICRRERRANETDQDLDLGFLNS
jgi:hypothetical protein